MPLLRMRHREVGLLASVTVIVLALGWITARDLRRSAEDASQLYERLSRGLDVINELQYSTQEVRRTLLYPLHTSNANLQLQYAEQSRAADLQVATLLERSAVVIGTPGSSESIEKIRSAWMRYLQVRDEVIGLILEGSLPEAVALDEREGSDRFNDVRGGIAALKRTFEADAAVQVRAARARAAAATQRLTLLVVSALIAAAVGVSLVSRRTVLESLLRIQAHKGSILQAVPDPILSTDAQGRIVELNDAAERTFGFTRAAALGAQLEDVIMPAERRGLLWPVLSRTRDAPRVVWPRIETVGRRQDGTEFPMELAAVTHEAGGERVWTVHVSDLTERQRTEEQLRRAKDAAEAADRTKSDFLATMSHELRTPLVGVVGIADLLQRAEPTATQRDLIAMLRSSANALLGLVSDVLDYSRIEAGLLDLKPAVFNLCECIEDALDPVTEPAARKGLDLGWIVDHGVPKWIVADQARVRQVLLNLLSNAVKFTNAGEVAVSVSLEASGDGGTVIRARVRDTGIGIPAHLQDRLFRRFSQISEGGGARHGGAGLGLAISQRLSRLLGGSIAVESEPERGSTFTFLFNAGVDHASVVGCAVDRPLEHRRVLVIARPGVVCEHLQWLLRGWGATTHVAPDAASLAAGDAWDAVIADADTFAGGPAAAEAALRATTPLVLITRARAVAAAAQAAAPRVNKPIKARALRAALESSGAIGLPEPAPVESTLRALPQHSLRVLLVEDNDANRRVVGLMIKELGLDADLAAGGIEAVEASRRSEYDVILMDLQMPDLDGLEATRRIRRDRPVGGPAIVALTANAMQGEEERCRQAGMDGYLPKPIRLETLANVLLPLAGRRPAVN